MICNIIIAKKSQKVNFECGCFSRNEHGKNKSRHSCLTEPCLTDSCLTFTKTLQSAHLR